MRQKTIAIRIHNKNNGVFPVRRLQLKTNRALFLRSQLLLARFLAGGLPVLRWDIFLLSFSPHYEVLRFSLESIADSLEF